MLDTSSLQKQQGIKPHRPGRTITCYYCGLVLHEKHLQAHMKQCPLVLEGCPNKCGVTAERREMKHHLSNECMNVRRPTDNLQLTTSPHVTTKPQHNFDAVPMTQQCETRRQPVAVPEEWNEKVVAALTVVKKALLKEENERCQAQAELKLELKNLNQHMQMTDDRLHNAVSQVKVAQFHELKEEVLLLKESLKEEREERCRIGQQLAYEVEKSNIWYRQVNDLKMKLEEYRNEMETWKIRHEEEVHRLLQEVVQERNHRHRAETELRMEAAKLEDMFCALEQWRDEDERQRYQLEEQHVKREVEWKGQVEQQKGEVDKMKKVVEKYCHDVDEFHEFLSSENVMISGLWAEQLAEVRSITERVESLNKVSEAKFKEIAQLKQQLSECDEAITRQVRGNCTIFSGHIIWTISDFEAKMTDAKENSTVLHSPVFYSSQHGYKLRVEVRLNGLGQWTGRHMTASLQVLEGEWDPLLQWPFNQRVTLRLRDQNNASDKVNDLVKNLVEGQEKEDPAGLHVFIPHATLQQHNYVLNNIMFLEVTVGKY
ncbi:TNF receptor-associated factor 3 isoform X2 [Zootermopsis nevadensis]|nr:TNF receptor-associated factor 3 isoform X2 [Zootermopsis nevadensis]XP_021937436.1 TNF receptor-associated factor 3 isoform X2 [Zootermopsis nevadensis]XP_021937437.1 TNF receptor-associated factor 3 isoform X2 [Zootermopsis nevadensis]XP_021937438.1 TNF receptor-associated factor 3 isoform X2 [Zootermopsis nevadensis]XP_021937439.1 TNF receptor-associated factor 3 isoform X2 [Zootermopsis nevadensis]XP_021937440.1 TNF receptor-associated factor 3 isoform X2 [Zootermopsis nevadensis]